MARSYLIDVNDTVRPCRPLGMTGIFMRGEQSQLGRVTAATGDTVTVRWDTGHTTTYVEDEMDFIERAPRPRNRRRAA